MALATLCPHCGTMFRVAADQLKLRGGIVRCGACQQVFDGNKSLVDLSAPPPSRPPAQPAEIPEPPSAPSGEAGNGDELPIYTLEFDRTFSPFGILPRSAQADAAAEAAIEEDEEPAEEQVQPDAPAAAPAAEPEQQAEPESAETAVLDLPVDEELVAAPLPGHEHDHEHDHEREHEPEHETGPELEPEPVSDAEPASTPIAANGGPPLLLRESSGGEAPILPPPPPPKAPPKSPRNRAAESRARRSKLTPTKIDAPKLRVPETDEPEFVRRGRQREESSKAKRIALAAGCALLALVLAAQVVLSFRDVLAARYPGAKPALASACSLLGCKIALPAQIDKLVIETGELTTLGGNAYTLTTLLRNEGDLVLAWPSIELTLNDADDKPLVRRVFAPRDYLPQGVAGARTPAEGFGARAEQPVKLNFRVEGLAPSGYHIAVFYP